MILPFAKKLSPKANNQDAVYNYLISKEGELESEAFNRLFGVKNAIGGFRRAGYNVLRDFFEGDQWQYSRDQGSSMSVTNFCRMTVNNYTAFLTQEEPEIDIPPRDPKDDVEVARVKEVEQLLKEILEDNQFYNVFYEGAQNGSLLGDTMIVGPFYYPEEKRIGFRNVKRPEFIRVIWESEDYDRIVGFFYAYYMGPEAAQTRFGDKLAAKGMDVTGLISRDKEYPTKNQPTDNTKEGRVLIRELWDEQVYMLVINNVVVDYKEHNEGFVPLVYIRNVPHPTEPYGISDIEDLLDPQVAYNEQNADMQDIIKQVAFASIFGKNLEVDEIQAGVAKIYDLGDDAEVFPDPRNTNFPFLQTYLTDKKGDVDLSSGIPDVFQGGKGVRDVSGRALSVLMTPINNRVRGKEKRWSIGLKQLVKNILILIENHVPGAEVLVQHHYKADIFFPGTLVRDVTDELNKFIQKVQSQYTTMKNIGIASPKDEQELMKKELADARLGIEISRQPQMQAMITQMLLQTARQNAQARANQANANQPTLTEGQNQGGETPQSAPNVPVGTTVPAGAAAGASPSAPPVIPNA